MTEYERGDRFYRDYSWADPDDEVGQHILDNKVPLSVERVVEDVDTGETLYWLVSEDDNPDNKDLVKESKIDEWYNSIEQKPSE
jgi:hypothetical protein